MASVLAALFWVLALGAHYTVQVGDAASGLMHTVAGNRYQAIVQTAVGVEKGDPPPDIRVLQAWISTNFIEAVVLLIGAVFVIFSCLIWLCLWFPVSLVLLLLHALGALM